MDQETPADADRRADKAAVSGLYRILLGRHPENEAVVAEHDGQPLAAIIALVLQSMEFRQIVHNVEAGQPLPHTHRLTLTDIDQAASWLEGLGESLPLEPNWWAMIGVVFACAPSSAVAEYQNFAALLDRRSHVASTLPSALERAAVFDPDWYARAHRDAALAIRDGSAADVESYFIATGRDKGHQLLPEFSERLPEIYQHLLYDASVGEIARATARAANRGLSGHWLFSEHYYVQSSEAADGAAVDRVVETPYVQFLSQTSLSRARPHPLFCPRSYALLNDLSNDEANFDHYIRVGLFEGFQTSALFEPSFYAHVHPEVGLDILQGKTRNELHHFLSIGVFEDARFSPYFDADFYVAAYPDVAAEIAAGVAPSATWHFVYHGLAQGRSPSSAFNADYYRARYPHIAAELAELGLGSALEHYLLIGRQRGYAGDVPLIERRASLDDGKVIFQRRALRSLDRQMRTPLAFPAKLDSPVRLSVIVPVSGQAHHTARLIECAHYAAAHLLATCGIAAQLIFVDNGSRDETAGLLAATAGVTTIRMPDPVGYPRAIIAGIEAVEGEFVLVTNNDVEFEPDAFVRIVERLSADATIGVLGGLVMLPNERVQDAGSFVDHEGFTVGVGRHEDPWSAFMRGVREVDYCAGCFFAFRLDDYRMLGGVDDQFTPGYFEEVDFAFRMKRQRGKRAVVDSDIQVVHLEHGSFGGGLTPVATEPFIRRNRALFLAKHARALADRPSSGDLLHDYAARPGGIGRQRALVIVSRMPVAGELWPATLLDGLDAADVPFEILVLESRSECDAYADRRVNILRGWLPGQDPRDIIARAARRFSHIIVTEPSLLASLGAVLAEAVEKAQLSLICSAEALPIMAEFDSSERLGNPTSDASRIALVRASISSEAEVALWLASTEADRDLLVRAGARRAVTVDWAGRDDDSEMHIALVGCGSMDTDVDDALAWYRRSVAASVPASIMLTPRTLLSPGSSDSVGIAVGLQPVWRSRTDGLRVALIPPRLEDMAEVHRALGSGLPVLMMDHHRRRIEQGLGPAVGELAIVDEDVTGSTYASWFARLRTDPALVDRVVGVQRAWLAGRDAGLGGLDSPRVVAVR